jgi:hypothetical protein
MAISDDDWRRRRVPIGHRRILVVMGSGFGFADPE